MGKYDQPSNPKPHIPDSGGSSDSDDSNSGGSSSPGETQPQLTGREIEQLTSAGTAQTYGAATIAGKQYPTGGGQDPAARATQEKIRKAAETRQREKESPAQTYVRTLRQRGSEASQRFAQTLEEKRFIKQYRQLEKQLESGGFKTTAAQIVIGGMRGETPEQTVQRIEGEKIDRMVDRTRGMDISDIPDQVLSEEEKRAERLKGFEERTEELKRREREFFTSEGFERISKLAGIMTGGKGRPIEERGYFGVQAQKVVTGLLGWPIAMGGMLPILGGKVAAVGEAISIPETRKEVLPELKRAGIEALQVYKEPSTYITAAIFALPMAAAAIAAKKPVFHIRTGVKGGVKTTLIYKPTRGKPTTVRYEVPSGKRVFVFAKGKPIKAPSKAIVSIPQPKTIELVMTIPTPKTKPVGIFAPLKDIPSAEPPSYLKSRAKEIVVSARVEAGKQTVSDFISGIAKPTVETPSKLMRVFRKEIVAKRSIKPLDISARGIFAKELPPRPKIIIEKKLGEKAIRKQIRKDILAKRSIAPLVIPPSIFAVKPRPVEPITYLRTKKVERERAAMEQLKRELKEKEITPTIETPARLRRVFRKGIVAKGAVTPLAIAPVGIFAARIPKAQKIIITKKPSTKILRKRIRKEIVAKRSIKPLDISPKAPFVPVEELPPYSRLYTKQTVKEARVRYVKLAKVRRLQRKEIVAKRSIKPLDISARGIFAKELPLYQKPSYYKVKRKELGVVLTRGIKPTRGLFIPPKYIREYMAGRKRIPYVTKLLRIGKPFEVVRYGYVKGVRAKAIKEIAARIKEKMVKPIITIQRVRAKASEIFRAKPLEVVGGIPSGTRQILLQKVRLKKPSLKLKQVQIQVQLQKQVSKQTTKQILRQQPKLKTKQTLDQLLLNKQLKGMEQIEASAQTRFVGMRVLQKQRQKQVQSLAKAQLVSPVQAQAHILGQVQAQTQLQAQEQTQAQLQLQEQAQALDVGVDSLLDLSQATAQLQRQIIDVPSPPPPPTPTPPPPPPPPPTFIKFPTSEMGIEKEKVMPGTEPGYDTLVKRKQLKKGKGSYQSRGYKKANTKPLTKEAAHGLGMSITDTYSNRSYMIKKSKRLAKKREDLERLKQQLQHKFRAKKGKPNVLVEKTKYAIDSSDEIKGIPYESARLRRAGLLDLKERVRQKKKELTSKISTFILTETKKKKKQKQINFLASKKKKGDSNWF